jgi:hypothetical protein
MRLHTPAHKFFQLITFYLLAFLGIWLGNTLLQNIQNSLYVYLPNTPTVYWLLSLIPISIIVLSCVFLIFATKVVSPYAVHETNNIFSPARLKYYSVNVLIGIALLFFIRNPVIAISWLLYAAQIF